MEISKSSRKAGILLVLIAVLGAAILAMDKILWQSMGGTHAYALIALVIVDLVIAILLLTRPSKMSLTVAAVWSILRMLLQVADVYNGPAMSLSYGDFANYLFNPTLVTAPNPLGVPAALIDAIIILQLIVIVVALTGRSASQK
jgi:hypothetical protein